MRIGCDISCLFLINNLTNTAFMIGLGMTQSKGWYCTNCRKYIVVDDICYKCKFQFAIEEAEIKFDRFHKLSDADYVPLLKEDGVG